MWVRCHKGLYDKLTAWIADKRAYLQTKEVIESIQAAELQRGLLAAYIQEKSDMDSSFTAVKVQGNEIRTAVYRTQYSSWQYEDIAEVAKIEKVVLDASVELSSLTAHKQAILDDDLARETFRV